MKDLSICIVNYNTPDLTSKCIESIQKHTKDINYEIIVVDNASKDKSVKILKERFGAGIKLITERSNRFFSGGFNAAFSISEGRYCLILNSDAYIEDNAFLPMTNFLDSHPEAGAVTGCIVDIESRKITQTATMELTQNLEWIRSKRILRMIFNRAFGAYIYSNWNRESDKQIEVACDAFLMVRKDILELVGGYNEAMKLYYTEEYLSDKIRELKFTIWHLAAARVMHAWSSSTKKSKKSWINAIYQTDKILYFCQKYGR